MFGPKMKVARNSKEIVLRPLTKEDMKGVSEGFSDFEVLQFLGRLNAPSMEMEIEWYEKVSKSDDTFLWGIEFQGNLIGTTGVHNIENSCATTGVVIWNKKCWGNGLVSLAHLGRTLYASEILNLHLIRSHVWSPNISSRKALERVGYCITGEEYFKKFHFGEWLNLYELLWINPRYAEMYANSLEIKDLFNESIEKAKSALECAKEVVSFR